MRRGRWRSPLTGVELALIQLLEEFELEPRQAQPGEPRISAACGRRLPRSQTARTSRGLGGPRRLGQASSCTLTFDRGIASSTGHHRQFLICAFPRPDWSSPVPSGRRGWDALLVMTCQAESPLRNGRPSAPLITQFSPDLIIALSWGVATRPFYPFGEEGAPPKGADDRPSGGSTSRHRAPDSPWWPERSGARCAGGA